MKIYEVLDPFQEPEGEDENKQNIQRQVDALKYLRKRYSIKMNEYINNHLVFSTKPKNISTLGRTYIHTFVGQKSRELREAYKSWYIRTDIPENIQTKIDKTFSSYYDTITKIHMLSIKYNFDYMDTK